MENIVICTEKDAVKLWQGKPVADTIAVLAVPLVLTLDAAFLAAFDAAIDTGIDTGIDTAIDPQLLHQRT